MQRQRWLSEGGDLDDGKAVAQAMRNTTFKGVGNRVVALDQNGDRIESYEVMNYVVLADGRMGSVGVGMYDSIQGQYNAYERAVIWPGNVTAVPVDYVSGAAVIG